MEPIINIDDPAGKTVGRRKPAAPLRIGAGEKESSAQWRRHFGGGLPKGVYRFNSHEEADEWTWQMMMRRKK